MLPFFGWYVTMYEEELYYEEPHSLEDYIIDGEVVGEWCPECGIIYRPGIH